MHSVAKMHSFFCSSRWYIMMRWKASRRCPSSYLEGPQISSIGMADILVGIRIRSSTNTEYTSLIVKKNNCDSCNGYIPVLIHS